MKNLLMYSAVLLAFLVTGCKQNNELIENQNRANKEADLVIKPEQYQQLSSNNGNAVVETVSGETSFNYSGKSVKVKAYSRNVGDTKNSPIFEYADLLNRAITYKNAHPQTDVQVKFVMYKIGLNSYVGFNPSDVSSYGFVKGSDFAGANSEQLAYSLVKAALNQVKVDFVYHLDVSASVSGFINGYMETPCTTNPAKKVKDFLRMRKVSWGTESYQQMHAKYMTVSHYTGDAGDVLNTVYSTTGNVDDHGTTGIPTGKDWVQSGILITGHAELMQSFNKYADLVYNNYANQANFRTAVRSMHSAHSLNYDDQYFSSYFTPIPQSPAGNYVAGQPDSASVQGNAWDTSYNPVAKYVSQMASTSGNRYLKVNMYHLKMDNFGKKFYTELQNIYQSSSSGTKEFKFLAHENSYQDTRPLSVFNNIGTMRYIKPTHAKNLTFAFSGTSSYYTLTGSTNLKLDDNASKANTTIVVKEFTTDHPVYNAFKDIFEYQF
ncbi:hypothetical protein [Pedobacter sp. UBA5917]|uniref:hypothetical protein n=1 Tax=Pedobacter sp. UBA5917 TaxID=1947061 RepID=UPI0025F3E561|nr:hypothetical protein [Pedobacter sp. UBA5917]